MTKHKHPRHIVTDVDRAARTAICSICGPTGIKLRTGGGVQCMTVVRRQVAEQVARPRRPRTKEQLRASKLRQKYKLEVEDFELMLEAQGGLCDICGRPMDPPHVDHNHETGKVRALLCLNCNTGMGNFRDDITLLQAAIDFLRRHDG